MYFKGIKIQRSLRFECKPQKVAETLQQMTENKSLPCRPEVFPVSIQHCRDVE